MLEVISLFLSLALFENKLKLNVAQSDVGIFRRVDDVPKDFCPIFTLCHTCLENREFQLPGKALH